MKELRKQYMLLKQQAIELMKAGKINAYLATLQRVNDVKFQMIQLAASH